MHHDRSLEFSAMIGILIAWFNWIDPALRSHFDVPPLKFLSYSRSIERTVKSAYHNFEAGPRLPEGVEIYHYRDHPIYITGGESTKDHLNHFYSMTTEFLKDYGGRRFIEGEMEYEVPQLPQIDNAPDHNSARKPYEEYNESCKTWARNTHHEQASLIGACKNGIIEGTTPGTPLPEETAIRLEERIKTYISESVERVNRDSCQRRRNNLNNFNHLSYQTSSPTRYGDWLGRGR